LVANQIRKKTNKLKLKEDYLHREKEKKKKSFFLHSFLSSNYLIIKPKKVESIVL
jgi:hypothetical protein